PRCAIAHLRSGPSLRTIPEWREASHPRLYLRDGLHHQLVHFHPNLFFGDRDALGGEIAHHLAEHVAVAGFLEIGRHDLPGRGGGGVARHAELFRRPQSEQLVAARFGLELLLFVESELLLEAFLALIECRHFKGSDLPKRRRRPRCGSLVARLDSWGG